MKIKLFHWYDKLLSFLLTLLGFGGGFTSCIHGMEYGPDPNDIFIDLSTLDFSPIAGEHKDVNITTENKWSFTSVPEFVTVSKTTGAGNAKVIVTTTEENTSPEMRSGQLVIGNDYYSETIQVYQQAYGSGYIIIEPSRVSLPAAKNKSEEIRISTVDQWTITQVPDYFSVSKISGTGNTTVKITTNEKNTTGKGRASDIIIETDKGKKKSVWCYQDYK